MRYKKIGSSQYKGVRLVKTNDGRPWLMNCMIDGIQCVNRYKTERDAAKAYDIVLINNGREPVNILKTK